MHDADLVVRNATYRLFAELARAPTPAEVSRAAQVEPEAVLAAWRRLHDGHALVLEPGGTRLRMANPFSAVPTRHRVEAGGRSYDANCGWDAFGICAALHADGRITSSCPDCGDPIEIEVRAGRPDHHDLVFHSLVPARRWWDDIVFT